ncbi:hypothetical protein [Streptomyces sp. GQFP]|uniref:hypothetical protein n=1 Tax=Streptomyces sp. GQFP TaxID=2907545 RepID=UPI001F3C2E9F|nr:hypothetical protein [Streptomyces sp. GQFP]UIX31741.1 hypothetical protein LUX31_17790 [Streptomyces sp. GQFP]
MLPQALETVDLAVYVVVPTDFCQGADDGVKAAPRREIRLLEGIQHCLMIHDPVILRVLADVVANGPR